MGRVGDVECPDVEDTSSSCCCVGSEESRGGAGQRDLGCSLQDQKDQLQP